MKRLLTSQRGAYLPASLQLLRIVVLTALLICAALSAAQISGGGSIGDVANGFLESSSSRARIVAVSGKNTHLWALRADGTLALWSPGLQASTMAGFPKGAIDAKAIKAGYANVLVQKADGTLAGYGSNLFQESTIPAGLGVVQSFDSGINFSVAAKADGTVVVWGTGNTGPLVAPSGLSGVVQVSAGQNHIVALKSDGTVVAWGFNTNGQINVPAGLTGVVQVNASDVNSIALKSDGTVVVWGDNSAGQLTVPSTVTNVAQVFATYLAYGVIKNDGTVVFWGSNAFRMTSVPANLSGVTQLAVSVGNVLAVKSDGSMTVWPSSVGPSSGPMNVGQGVLQAAQAGSYLNLLRADGTVYNWNTDTPPSAYVKDVVRLLPTNNFCYYMRADGSFFAQGSQSLTNQPTGLTGLLDMATGLFHAVAIKSDGTVIAWGTNTNGQATVPAGLTSAVQVAAGSNHSLALTADGTVYAWGLNTSGQTSVPAGLSGVVQIAAGGDRSMALKSDGTVVTWGANNFGQGTVPTGLTGVVKIAASAAQSMAIKADGTLVVWGYRITVNKPTTNVLADVFPMSNGYLALPRVTVAFQSATVRSNGTVTGTVTLPIAPAVGSGGADVSLSTTSVNLSAPGTVHVAEGAHTATFTAYANAVAADEVASVIATYNSSTSYATVTISDSSDHLTQVSMSGTSVIGGSTTSITGTVYASGNVASDTVVSLTSSDTNYVTVPATVTIPAGQSSASFAVTTKAVSLDGRVTLNATSRGEQVTTSLDVTALKLASFSFDPATVKAGDATNFLFTLNAPVSANTTINLSTTDTSSVILSLPSTVTMPAGSSSLSVNVKTNVNAAGTSIDITAKIGTVSSITQTLSVTPRVITSIVFTPASVIAGNPATARVTLDSVVPATAVVKLTNSDPSSATVPATVSIPAGTNSFQFSVATKSTASATTLHVTGTLNTLSTVGDLVIQTFGPQTLTFNPSFVTAGASSTGTVTVNFASATDTTVTLTNDSPAYATVPASVMIPAGSTSATFTVTTVSGSTDQTAKITATANAVSATGFLNIRGIRVQSVGFAPSSTIDAGDSSTGFIVMTRAPLVDTTVALSNSNPDKVTIPSSLVVAAGSITGYFPVTTKINGSDQTADITATLDPSSATGRLTIRGVGVQSLVFDPAEVWSGSTSQGTITLSRAPRTDITIKLTNSNPTAATIPASVVITAGSTTATFAATTTISSSDASTQVSASYLDTTSEVTLTVKGFAVQSLTLTPSTVKGGSASVGCVKLNHAAPIAFTVTLTTSSPGAASLPASLVIPAGSTQANFNITTYPQWTTSAVTIGASILSGTPASATLTVTAPQVSSFIAPTTILGVQILPCSVTIDGPAPVGFTIPILATSPYLTFLSPVTFAEGSTSSSIYGYAGDPSASVNLQVTCGSKTVGVTIKPNLVASINVSPSTVIGGSATVVTGTVALTGPTYQPVAVQLSASDIAGATSVPVLLTIPVSGVATFTVGHEVVGAPTAAAIWTTRLGKLKSTSLLLLPNPILSVKITPSSFVGGSTTIVAGTVTLTYKVARDTVINLSSDMPGIVSVPATVTVLAGQKSANFPIAHADTPTRVTVTVSASRGGVSVGRTLTVRTNPILTHVLAPNDVVGVGGGTVAGTVTLASPVNTDMTITLTATNAAGVTIPATLVIPAGLTTGAYTIGLSAVTKIKIVGITATKPGFAKKANLTVRPG